MAANFQNVEEIDLNFGEEDFGSNVVYSSDGKSLKLESFRSADEEKIILANGRCVPVLDALEELKILTNRGNEFSQDQVLGMFAYAQNCKQLKKLSFIDCLLPLSLPVGPLRRMRMLHDIEVSWKPLSGFRLDSTEGKWISNSVEATTLEVPDQDENNLRLLCSNNVIIKHADRIQLQKSTKLLFEIASSHQIPISRVYLLHCFPRVDASGQNLILQSGLSLSTLSSLQKLEILDDSRKLKKEELAGILLYSSKCTSLNELKLGVGYKRPNTLGVGYIPPLLILRKVKVWILNVVSRRLNLENGQWQRCDQLGNLPEEEGFDARYF